MNWNITFKKDGSDCQVLVPQQNSASSALEVFKKFYKNSNTTKVSLAPKNKG